jgi:hypothetical protein
MSCEKPDKVYICNTPVEDLQWLKELKASFTNCSCQMSIIQATYNGQTVFYAIMNDPVCNSINQPVNILDCSGNTIKTYDRSDQAFGNEVTNRKSIYVCKTKK